MRTESIDIATISSGVIVLPTNCAGTIPYGTTLWQLAYKHPHVQRQYYRAVTTDKIFGKTLIVNLTLKPELTLALIFAQREYDAARNAGNKVDMTAFKSALQRVVKAYPKAKFYLPQFSGKAGDNWNEVTEAIKTFDVTLVIPPESETNKNSD